MSAAANKLTNFKQHAPTYAALIMEEFDPDHLGYIEVIFHSKMAIFLSKSSLFFKIFKFVTDMAT